MTAYDHQFEPDTRPGLFRNHTEVIAMFIVALIFCALCACFGAWAIHGFNFPGAQ